MQNNANRPEDYWFRQRRYGYGGYPDNWKGWAASVGFVVVFLAWTGFMLLPMWAQGQGARLGPLDAVAGDRADWGDPVCQVQPQADARRMELALGRQAAQAPRGRLTRQLQFNG